MEKILSGYCFQEDHARIVCAEIEKGSLLEADCQYETCIYRDKCQVGRELTEALKAVP